MPAHAALLRMPTARSSPRPTRSSPKARAAMHGFALHHVLADIWRVVGDANRYFAGARALEEEQDRSGAHGRRSSMSRPKCCATSRIMTQPFMPAAVERAARSSGRGAEACANLRLRAAADAALDAGAAAAAAPSPIFPRYVEPESRARRRRLMLIDSHCHLDFPEFAPERRGGRSRAPRPPASSGMITISTRVAQVRRLSQRSPRRYDEVCLHGRHASASGP